MVCLGGSGRIVEDLGGSWRRFWEDLKHNILDPKCSLQAARPAASKLAAGFWFRSIIAPQRCKIWPANFDQLPGALLRGLLTIVCYARIGPSSRPSSRPGQPPKIRRPVLFWLHPHAAALKTGPGHFWPTDWALQPGLLSPR